MRKLVLIILISALHSFAQKGKTIQFYNYGKNGIEYIVKNNNGTTVIVSTFNSRPTIKDEVAVNVYNYFTEKAPKNGDTIIISTNNAVVKGNCYVRIKGTLTSVEFHYETVEWKTGLTEIYNNPNLENPSSIAVNDD